MKLGFQADGQELIAYFGYGSLVNRSTLPASARIFKARLEGWQRAWHHSGPAHGTTRCTLTVRPKPDAQAWGVVVVDLAETLPVLKVREAEYNMRTPTDGQLHIEGFPFCTDNVFFFEGDDAHARYASEEEPIIQSYLDIVLTGFWKEYGQAGVLHFLRSTDGWQGPIYNDREQPIYPRFGRYSQSQYNQIDDWLNSIK